jgi:outer membrane protein
MTSDGLGAVWRGLSCGLLALIVAVAIGASASEAQELSIAIAPEEINIAGLGVGFAPDYPGSDDYTWGVAPSFRYEFGDNRYVELMGATLFANVLDHPFIRIGPLINYRFGRDDPDDTVVGLLSDVDDSIELGMAFGLSFVNAVNERIRFSTRLDVGGDVTGGHGGTLATLSMRYWHPLGRAARSGLAAFNPSDGVRDIAFTPILVMHLSREWHIGVGLRYARLLGDAADSPVTDVRGTPDQLIAGVGFAYSW